MMANILNQNTKTYHECIMIITLLIKLNRIEDE